MGSADTRDVLRLTALEPDVPGLRLLLDDDALTGWLAARLGPAAASTGLTRTYLRWKPGAGGVARVRVGGTGGADVFLAVWHRDAAAKLDKTVLRGGRAVVTADRDALAVLARPAADRDLPALARVLDPGSSRALRRLEAVDEPARSRLHRTARGPATTTTLAWKPQRRWVGLAASPTGEPLVLRAYRPEDLTVVRQRYRAVAAALGRSAPAVLGDDPRRGLLAVEHLRGRALDHVVGLAATAADRATGALLARLHGASVGAPDPAVVGRLDVASEVAAVDAAARTLELLVPGSGATALAAELQRALLGLPQVTGVLLHGDLSADQVVVDPAGEVGLIDLDEATVGPASYDLAGIAASWWLADPVTAAGRVRALHEGYRETRSGTPGPDPDELRVRTAAHLLRRAPEAFRTGRAGWPGLVRAAVAGAAAVLLDDRGPAASRTVGPLAEVAR